MYIKQVIIEGFKSYKEQVAIEPFSPKHNCIVGANGSGKTNFFNAIRFVLSDFTTQLRTEDRQRLLHDGAGQSVLSAYVEIVFDNSDNRLPIDKPVVRLRRSIGLKKDEFFLDRKHMTKPEVMNLLESAGFSRSNPYYVVQQGKIQALTVMRDTERLELLKDIGGTKVYDERRKESFKILHETASRQAQIEETIDYIDQRLAELNSERAELVQYQEVDRKRRAVEFALHEKEMSEARAKLDAVDAAREAAAAKAAKVHEAAAQAAAEAAERQAELNDAERLQANLSSERKTVEAERQAALEQKAAVELDVADLTERLQADTELLAEGTAELEGLEGQVASARTQLAAVVPTFEAKVAAEAAAGAAVADAEARLAVLYKKQGRASAYHSNEEKDKAVKKELQERTAMVDKKREYVARLEREIQEVSSSVDSMREQAATATAKLATAKAELEAAASEQTTLQLQRNELQNARNTHWQAEGEKEAALEKLQADMARKEKQLEGAMARDIQRGLASVRRICRDHRIGGVHGPLIELFECEERFITPVEVIAGNSLFHVVVDTDDIASKIIHYLTAEKGGRVSFLPLNRLGGHDKKMPESESAVPLLDYLRYDPKYVPAFKQVFGRVLLCREFDVATSMARSTNLDCITMEGDLVSDRGALKGGYHDHSSSRIAYMRAIRALAAKVDAGKREAAETKAATQQAEKQMNQLLTKIEKAAVAQRKAQKLVENLKAELLELGEKEKQCGVSLGKKQTLLRSAEDAATRTEAAVAELREELAQDVLAALTAAEKAELASLNPKIAKLKATQAETTTARLEVETRKNTLEAQLDTNLAKRKAELEEAMGALNLPERQQALEAKRAALSGLTQRLQHAADRHAALTKEATAAKSAATALKARLDELAAVAGGEATAHEDAAREMEKLLGKRHALLAKREALQAAIRDLGSLPSEAFEQYKSKSVKELQRLSQGCLESMKKFQHVNKKALDQFVQFTEQRQDLSRRQAEVSASKRKIQELIEGLDRKKDEDIERTFRGVAMHFKQIFQEIVQSGKGELVMIKNKEAQQPAQAAGDEHAATVHPHDPHRSVEKYSAVQVRVSFGLGGEAKTMKQLSGGQKAVVALSLIFAIQRVDPAPFYLFDEIDAALDAQYRAAVGSMIKKQAAANTQFVTTTFRPELVKVCSKVYGVTHKNRVSCVDVITKEDALGFIEDFN